MLALVGWPSRSASSKLTRMSDEPRFPPPWFAFPYMDWTCATGQAAFYLWKWTGWFRALDASSRREYETRFPEPDRWAGFYVAIETGKQPLVLKAIDEPDELDSVSVREYFEADSGIESDDQGTRFDPLDHLVNLLVYAAVLKGCDGIEVSDRAACLSGSLFAWR